MLGAFALAQAIAIAAGAPARRAAASARAAAISWGSVARTALLAAAAALLAVGWGAAPPPPLLPALAAIALAAAIVVRTRAARPTGALDIDGEGPPLGATPRSATASGSRCSPRPAVICAARSSRARARLGATVFDEAADAQAWATPPCPARRTPSR